jgi:hypothetical protein
MNTLAAQRPEVQLIVRALPGVCSSPLGRRIER